MDEDKNSSNLPPVDNTGAVGVPSGSANSNRQALFTPQPLIAEDSAPVPASAQASDGSSTHPYFSSHPTQTFSTDTGDIILNSGEPKPKQNKRPFIIGGIVLGIFVIVSVAVLAIASLSSNPRQNQVVTMQDAYMTYANYLLTGNIKNTEWQEPDQSNDYETMPDYEFYQQVYTKRDEQYFSTLDSLFAEFATKYDTEKDSLGDNQREQIDEAIRVFRETREKYTSQDSHDFTETIEEDVEGEESFELMQAYMVNTVQQDCWRILKLISPDEEDNA